MVYSFEIQDFDAGGRLGKLKLGGKTLDTPNLFPVVSPFENLIAPRRLYEHFGAQSIFTNAYILYKNRAKNPEILEKGLHKHLDFPGLIATDSGGFQDYMYAGDIKAKPEEIEPFQEEIGSDFPVILDIPVQTTDDYDLAKSKVNETIERAKANILRRKREDTAWFGPIHGSIYPDLLKKSALEMSKLDFGIYAIGGVVKTFIDYRFDLDVSILLEVRKWLRPDKPLHMFGLGLPAFFSLAVACGADLFDSAAYILYAKDNRYFTLTGTKNLSDLYDLPCHCPICTSYTLNELKKAEKNTRIKAIAEHNLYHSFSELRTIKNSIKEGTLWDLVEHRVQAHPKFVKALGKIKENPSYFQEMLNMNQTRGQMVLTDFSFYRPHFHNFRSKIEQFRFLPSKTHLFLLPELDLPTYHNQTVRRWIKQLKKTTKWDPMQICILSNTLGLIPLELADVYPASQHEGNSNPSTFQTHKEILLNNFHRVIENNSNSLTEITCLIPEEFVNEYGELEEFNQINHIISYVYSDIKAKYPQISLHKIHNLDD